MFAEKDKAKEQEVMEITEGQSTLSCDSRISSL